MKNNTFFLTKLKNLHFKLLFADIVNLFFNTFTLFAGLFFIFALIDNIFLLNILFRSIFFISLLLLILKHIHTNYLLIKQNTLLAAAKKIDMTYNFSDQIASALELQDSTEYNIFFINKLIANADKLIKKVKFSNIFVFKKFFISSLFFITAFLLFMLYAAVMPNNFKISINRLLNPYYKINYYHKIVKFDVSPGNATIIQGSSVKIKLTAYGKIHTAKINLHIDNSTEQYSMPLTRTTNFSNRKIYIYEYTIEKIFTDTIYFITTVQTRDKIPINSDKYKIKTVKTPYITKLSLTYKYPSYTHIVNRQNEENGNIEAVEKTLVYISGRANNNLSSGYISYNGKRKKIKISGSKFYTSLYLTKSGFYKFHLKDIYSNTNIEPVKYTVIVNKDKAPEVKISQPGMDLTVENNLKIELEIFAQDDFCINQLALHYTVKHPFIEENPKWLKIDFPIKYEQTITYNYKWDLNKLSFMPGDTVFYYASAYDGYKPADKHIAKSKVYKIKFPTMTDMYKDIQRDESRQISDIEKLLKDQKTLNKKTEKFLNDIADKKELSYIEQKQIEQFKQNQQKILEKAKNIEKKLNNIINKMNKNKMFSPEIIKKMQQIKELMSQIKNKDIKKNIERLNQLAKNIKLNQNKIQQLKNNFTSEKILKNLDKTIKMLKALKKEQQLQSFAKRTDSLIKKQKKLLDKTLKNMNNKSELKKLTKEQEKINKELQDLQKELNKFSKDKDLYKEVKKDINKALKNSRQSSQNMKQSANSLRSQDAQKSMQQQREAIKNLSNMKNSLSSSMSMKKQQDMSKIFNAFDDLLFNLINISQELEKIYIKLHIDTGKINNFTALRYKQEIQDSLYLSGYDKTAEKLIFIQRAIRWSYRKFETAVKGMLIFGSSINERLENLYKNLDNASQNIANRRLYAASNNSKNNLMYINIIINNLLDMKNQIKQQMKNQSGQGMQNSLNQLANAQEQLNKMTEKLMGKIGKEGMTPELQEYLEQLAMQQEIIRQATENFIKNSQNAGKLLGNLNKAAKEMAEIKKKLKSKKIDNNLLKKQKEILKRLLDSEKSLYTKSKSRKREAEKAKEYNVKNPEELQKQKINKRKNPYFLRQNEKYPLEYKNLIDDYFKVLNLEESIINDEK